MARALSRAGLRPPERFFLRFPHELSGGQRQRVVIAGALALEPRVIVADEPVSNLDASVRGEILRLLLKLRAESKISILIVTHDLGLAWTIADRVAVMYLGRIVEVGPTRAGPDAAVAPVHARAARRGAGRGGDPAAAARRRAARSDPHPGGLPVPPAVPGARRWTGRRGGRAEACRDAGPGARGVGATDHFGRLPPGGPGTFEGSRRISGDGRHRAPRVPDLRRSRSLVRGGGLDIDSSPRARSRPRR